MTTEITAAIVEGLYLMAVGMSFVLAFLTIVVFSLKILARVAPEEVIPASGPADKQQVNDQRLMAAISAAVHKYREEHES